MISLGIITLYRNQENKYISGIAKQAKHYGIEVYRFTPTCIDPSTEDIYGERYNNEKKAWESCKFPIPALLYDRCFYGLNEQSKKCHPIMQWLKQRPNTQFLGVGLPNKWEIFKQLSTNDELSAYIPYTCKATPNQVLRFLVKEKQVILKPESGSMGHGVVGIRLDHQIIHVITHKKQEIVESSYSTKQSFLQLLHQLFQQQPYLCQQLLPLTDETNRPFDIRILLQKNHSGDWEEVGRGIRKGKSSHLISNISGGGDILTYDSWFSSISKKQQYLLKENIQLIINKLPRILEESFQPLFELGIDIGVTKDGAVWLLDCNSKPGRKVILACFPEKENEIHSAALKYCNYLVNNTTKV